VNTCPKFICWTYTHNYEVADPGPLSFLTFVDLRGNNLKFAVRLRLCFGYLHFSKFVFTMWYHTLQTRMHCINVWAWVLLFLPRLPHCAAQHTWALPCATTSCGNWRCLYGLAVRNHHLHYPAFPVKVVTMHHASKNLT